MRSNLQRLVGLRWFLVTGLLVLMVLGTLGIELLSPAPAAWAALGVYLSGNLLVHRCQRNRATASERFVALNLIGDLVAMYWFLAASGGSANPFTLLFLVPVIVAAATLRAGWIWLVTSLSIAAYSGLLWRTQTAAPHHGASSEFDLHLIGMWLGLVVVALLVAYYVTHMNQALRDRERQLALAREREMRDERVIALGALAAGAAHELGTPLSTMAVVSGDLREQPSCRQVPEVDRKLQLLQDQIDRCKNVLHGLSRHGAEARAAAGSGMTPEDMLGRVIDNWRSFRPGREVALDFRGAPEPPRILADETLAQAIASLLNNAAEACDKPIRVQASCDNVTLHVSVIDRGSGIPPEVLARLEHGLASEGAGDVPPTGGMGIGLLLTVATIERLGGSIVFRNHGNQGTRVSFALPLDHLILDGNGPVSRLGRESGHD